MLRRLIPLCLFLLLIAACVGSSESTTTTAGGTSTTEAHRSTSTTAGDPGWTELPGVEDLPASVQIELLELIRLTEEIRELRFEEPPLITLVTEAELDQRINELIAEEAEDFPADDALYKLLGLLEPTDDLTEMLEALYTEQALGFYDGETGEMVVPVSTQGFTATQRATMVHELTHALTDAHFEYHGVMTRLIEESEFDQLAAYRALIEGDAQHVEFKYLQTLSFEELGTLIGEMLSSRLPR